MELHFEIENGCLLQCRHCSSDATDCGKRMEYSAKAMSDFVDLFSEDTYVFLTGGEPLLHENLDEIVALLHHGKENVSVGLFTTGIRKEAGRLSSVSEAYAGKLCSLGLKVCYCSLYSSCAEEHDWMTGIKGSFDLTLNSIKNLIAQGIEVKINFVVTKKNKKHLNDVIEMVSTLGCTEVRLLKLIRHGRAEDCWEEIGLTESEYRDIVKDALKSNGGIHITVSGCPDIAPCRPFEDASGCGAGSQLAYVTFEGDVFPCASKKKCSSHRIGMIHEIDVLRDYFVRPRPAYKKAICEE